MDDGIDEIKHNAVKGKYHVTLQEIAESWYQRQFGFLTFGFSVKAFLLILGAKSLIKRLFFEKKSFLIKNNDDVFQFRFNDDFKIEELKELQENEVVRVKGSFDQDEEGIFMMARDFLVMPSFSQGEE